MRVKTYLRRTKEKPAPMSEDKVGIYEYPDMLLVLYMNTLVNKNSPKALRKGIEAMLQRIESPRVRYIMLDIKRSPSPSGRLNFYYAALERDLIEIAKLQAKENPS